MASELKRIVLHCGLPKTGTTALQHWCTINREELVSHGVDYPLVEVQDNISPIKHDRTPKHGFLISAMRTGDMGPVRRAIENAAAPTLLMSTEGLSNHFYSFAEESLERFREAVANTPVDLLMFVRNKETWLRSLWKEGVIAFPGTVHGFPRYINLPAIQALADWPKLARDMQAGFGARDFHQVELEDQGWKAPLLEFLGISDITETPDTQEQFNVSVGNELIQLLRQLNTQRLDPDTRLMFLSMAQELLGTSHLTLQNAHQWGSPDNAQLLELKRALENLQSLPKPSSELKNRFLASIDDALTVSQASNTSRMAP